MARIIGIDIPDNKRLVISLTYIYGIGRRTSEEIITKLGLDPDQRVHNLSEDDKGRISTLLQAEYVLEGDRRRQVQNDIRRLVSIKSYRGSRHRLGLPVRGQKTQKNSRTRKGKAKTVAGKKK